MRSVIYIMWIRQIKKYLRSRSRIIGSLAQPLLFFLALGFGLGPVFAKANAGNYLDFLAPGIIAMSILFTATFNGIELIWDKQFGFLKESLVAPVSRYKLMFGRCLGGATVASVQGLIVLGLTMIFGFRPVSVLGVIISFIFMFLIAMFFTAIGTAIASKLEDMQGFQLIVNFFIMPVFFLSGALFPLDGLPSALGIVTRFDPLTYGVDGVRGALLGASHLGLWLDFGILAGVVIFVMALGTYLFSKMEV